MHNFFETKKYHLLIICGTSVLIFFMINIYTIGFGSMAVRTDLLPERLRDYTFPIWQQYSFLEHGFLMFLAPGDFQLSKAYSNHSTLYLLFMNMLYKLQLIYPSLTMRIVGAFLAMSASLAAIVFVVFSQVKEDFNFKKVILILLGLIYFMTMPTFWISLGKFNVDNPFVFIFPLLILVAYQLSLEVKKGFKFWVLVIFFCAVTPTSSVLLAIFLLIKSFNAGGMRKDFMLSSIVFALLGSFFYLEPVVFSKILGFTSKNSGWLFRSGLDGDTQYYSNFINSVLHPVFIRPVYILFIPILLLSVQLLYSFNKKESTDLKAAVYHSEFLQILFSVYVLSLLFWPQAISIHPYLYDHLVVAPIAVWIILNFSFSSKYVAHFSFWALLMLFFVVFNLTQIAQAAHCKACYYPTWDISGSRDGV